MGYINKYQFAVGKSSAHSHNFNHGSKITLETIRTYFVELMYRRTLNSQNI